MKKKPGSIAWYREIGEQRAQEISRLRIKLEDKERTILALNDEITDRGQSLVGLRDSRDKLSLELHAITADVKRVDADLRKVLDDRDTKLKTADKRNDELILKMMDMSKQQGKERAVWKQLLDIAMGQLKPRVEISSDTWSYEGMKGREHIKVDCIIGDDAVAMPKADWKP